MIEYYISGVWKNKEGIITHYAIHLKSKNGIGRAKKTSKTEAISIVEMSNNTVFTWVWSYIDSRWKPGEKVEVVNGINGKFLRSNPDQRISDNLGHLIDFDWIAP